MGGPPNSQQAALPTSLPFQLISKTIGTGAYASIRKAVPPGKTGPVIAVKFINKDHAFKTGHLRPRQLQLELALHERVCPHPNIIRFHAHGEDANWIWMCLELADGGDLFDKIEADEGVNENTAHMYFTQLINAIGWCHDKGVAHRDIKPENILLSGTGDLKLADFGLATQFQVPGREGKKTTMMVCGSPPYIAPEILAIGNVNLKRRKDEEKAGYCPDIADVWSCAIVLFVLLAGNTPWDLPVLEESYEYNEYVHSSGRPDDELWEKVPDHALDLLRAMLTVNPPDRLAISQVKTHAWYTRENPYVADRVALATSMLENMRVFNEDKPPSASQPQKPRASQRTDAMDVDRRSDAWAHLGVPDQPETPIAATPFDWQVAPPLGSQRFSQLGDASLTSHLADDPSMSQFSQTPAVPLRLTQQHDTTFTDILPAGSMTRLLSEWAPRQFLPLVLGALRALDVRLSAPPDTDDPDAPPRLPLAVRVKCLDGRRQPLHGTVVFERVAVLGRELLQLDFRKVKGDPVEWRRLFKHVAWACRQGVLTL
nr:serine/threonine-protein kinase chk1-like [Quercus suber]